ncbi:interleukin-8-like [Periophthalmus magnuspinnatus]|uniref:interleukin-8-like n=1 Tax=Periophthalmus magnuspinnatus TaxID=409849 RepID=UPI00145A24DD|nr:interleukin-8-like [Periophthalmus magnuspinnatus]
MSPLITVALVFLLTSEVIVQGDQALNLRCQCIQKESKRIGRYLGKVEVHPANSHCRETEIVATLKKDGQKVCLDPSAQWVKRILRRNQKRKNVKTVIKG